ncbi:staygreen family protein [Clostridiisalibacter paucivorans]|uniref:staygreen family protein n=1 Tax=Clostridiisalibacter paucivorans TaxID=408753 RepID=UPI00047A4FA1|nr:staygreen family protein [Clostridiisalibacter paucivorans]
MKTLNPEKLNVEFKKGVDETGPIIPRRYTLTHSDTTGELFLTIGLYYAYENINPLRDEVLAEWRILNDKYVMIVHCYVSGPIGKDRAKKRYEIFNRELPLALEAIRYGDRIFFETHKFLDKSPIWVYFRSYYPEYNSIEYWGKPKMYK